MNNEKYSKFRERVGKIQNPTKQDFLNLFMAENGVHFHVKMGIVSETEYMIDISDEMMDRFIDILDLLESRDAERGTDFIVSCGIIDKNNIELVIHSTQDFLSIEDFEDCIVKKL